MESTTSDVTFVANDWEEYARCYDGLMYLNPYKDMLRMVAKEVLTGDQEIILDASCGTGNFETILSEERTKYTGKVVGVDSSSEMLERAKKKCVEQKNISFLPADLNNYLPFKSKSFSQVVSLNTLYAVESPETTLKEFYRVLKPGGRLLLVTPTEQYENGLILKEHCDSSLHNDFWKDAHASPEREEMLIRSAIKDEDVIQKMITVARYNRNIAANANFHFYRECDLVALLIGLNFSITQLSLTYAQQDFFIIATKGA